MQSSFQYFSLQFFSTFLIFHSVSECCITERNVLYTAAFTCTHSPVYPAFLI